MGSTMESEKTDLFKYCPRVNRKLLPVKLHYFLFQAALAFALPFRTVFAKQLGVSATEVGVIFCAAPLLRIVTHPFFGFLLDYFKKIRLTISVIMIAVAISLVALAFIPSKSSTRFKNFEAAQNNFRTIIKHTCHTRMLSQVCDHEFLMFNEYRTAENTEKNETNFSCDIECLESPTGITEGNRQDILQCIPKLKFDLNVLVSVSRCDMGVRIDKGEVITGNVIRNLINVNSESVVTPFQNCSIDIKAVPTFVMQNDENAETDQDISDNSKETINAAVGDGNKKYQALREFKINTLPGDLMNNNACLTEYSCKTKKCFYKTHLDGLPSMQTKTKDEFLSPLFWILFFLTTVSTIAFSAVLFMMDTVCYELLQDKRDQYGNQRLYGTIGWGIGALLGGYLNQIVSTDSGDIDYTKSFYMLAVLILIDLIPVNQIKVTNLKYSPHILKDVCFLLTKFDIVYNLIIVFIIGFLSGFIWNYQFWFMEEIGSSQVLLGLSQTFECLFEIPCFVMSGWIIKKIGHDHCNSITFLCFGLRYLCFVFMYDPWWTLAAALFHGPTFGLFYASMTMFAKSEAPPGTEATVQSLIHLSFEGLGVATGSMLGGIGVDYMGSRSSFMYAANMCFLMLIVNILMSFFFKRTKKKSKQIEQPECLS